MNIIIKRVAISATYLLLAFFIFLELVNLLQFPTNIDLKNIDEYTLVLQEKEFLNTIEEKIIKDKILQISGNSSLELGNLLTDRYIFFTYIFENNNHIIPLIYIVMLLIYMMQVSLFLISKYYSELRNKIPHKKLESILFYGSDFAINSPAILGVIGTIFALGMMVNSSSDASNLNTQFKENFANLSQTTIIGGVVYVINLFLNILINKNISLYNIK